ncbi:hypothetical protein [Massilia pseudoviolaceinigra]|uniref:hypothetical protein n=1 Tax=Massilia pseudoviolaceinigra TaxID=3057165 RepID=UPI002796CC16|nr:hypothetical protein [Massilia sp. CCM 9206]MDQ1924013.1 hypothetical protein [Massilia sp. CCM 9206]
MSSKDSLKKVVAVSVVAGLWGASGFVHAITGDLRSTDGGARVVFNWAWVKTNSFSEPRLTGRVVLYDLKCDGSTPQFHIHLEKNGPVSSSHHNTLGCRKNRVIQLKTKFEALQICNSGKHCYRWNPYDTP